MTRSTIFTVSDGKLTAMKPAAPESEDVMQRLVAQHPEIIGDSDGDLLLIRREQPIGDGEGDGRWSLDHLFVTREGIPVLVELKRAVDTRLRREVVGQMLDYAANATAYWKAGTIAQSFEATALASGEDPEELLAAFLADDRDPEEFWQRVDDSFVAGRIKLVFVADTIPRELARIVEFLNEQMKADVRAVELNWFEGGGVKAFTPRIIGDTQRAQAAKASSKGLPPPVSVEEWIEANLARYGAEAVKAGYVFQNVIAQAGGNVEVAQRQGSIPAVFALPVGTIYPMSISYGKITLNLGYLQSRSAFATEASRQQLYDRLVHLVGPLSTSNLTGFPGFPAGKLNDPQVQAGIVSLLTEVSQKCASS